MSVTRKSVILDVIVCDWCGASAPAHEHKHIRFDTPDLLGEDLHFCVNPEDLDEEGMAQHSECLARALIFAARCRKALIVDANGEIQLAACRECGSRFGEKTPHSADGLCVHCAPRADRTCPHCNLLLPEHSDACPHCAANVG